MSESYTVEQVAEFERFMADPGRREAFAQVKRRYDRVFSAVFSTPWAILDSYMEVVATVLVEHLAGELPTSEEVAARIEAAQRSAPTQGQAGVAVIPMHGVIMPRASAMAETSGGMSIERFRGMFRDAMSNKAVSSIVLDVDSPGGSVQGVPEMAAEMRAARGRKPVIAAISGMGASAAYWLASQADEIVITPSGLTGSIGVITAHEDVSKAAADKGVKVSLISAGKHKTDGNPFEPLSDEAREHTQAMVDEFYSMFVSDVAEGRRVASATVTEGFGEGRVVQARSALAQGMVDRIATVEDVVGERLAGDIAASAVSIESTTRADVYNVTVDADAVFGTIGANTTTTTTTSANTVPVDVDEVVPEVDAAVDNSSWDANRAMTACKTARDYAQIAFPRTVGESDERSHWALPHHYLGQGPNARGVAAAKGRLNQTQNLASRSAVSAHLDAHSREIESARVAAKVDLRSMMAELEALKLGRS